MFVDILEENDLCEMSKRLIVDGVHQVSEVFDEDLLALVDAFSGGLIDIPEHSLDTGFAIADIGGPPMQLLVTGA
jgi:hypothetical protein